MDERLMPYVLLGTCILFGAIAQILFKVGISQVHRNSLFEIFRQMVKNSYLITGILLYGMSFILWLFALRYLDISFMYPLLSLAYIAVVLMSVVFLKEEVHPTRWIGVLLIVIGAILVGLNK